MKAISYGTSIALEMNVFSREKQNECSLLRKKHSIENEGLSFSHGKFMFNAMCFLKKKHSFSMLWLFLKKNTFIFDVALSF